MRAFIYWKFRETHLNSSYAQSNCSHGVARGGNEIMQSWRTSLCPGKTNGANWCALRATRSWWQHSPIKNSAMSAAMELKSKKKTEKFTTAYFLICRTLKTLYSHNSNDFIRFKNFNCTYTALDGVPERTVVRSLFPQAIQDLRGSRLDVPDVNEYNDSQYNLQNQQNHQESRVLQMIDKAKWLILFVCRKIEH